MPSAREFLLTFLGDSSKAEGAIGRVDKGLGGLSTTIGSVSKVAGGIAVGVGLMKLPGFLQDATKAAADDAANVAKVDQALANMLDRTGQASTKINDLRADMEARIKVGQKLAFTDDEQRDALTLLLTQTDDYAEAQKRLRLAMDVSRGTGMDLQMSSKLLGKITDENIQVFKRYGITLEKGMTEGEALAAAQKLWGGQADAYAKSTAGQGAVVADQMSELKEQLGTSLLPVLEKVLPFVIKFFEALAKVPAPMLALGGVVLAVVGALVLLAPLISGLVAIAPLVGAAFTLMLGPIGLVVGAIAVLIGIGVLLWKNWDTVKQHADSFGLGGVVSAIEAVAGAFKTALQWGKDFFGWLDSVAPGGKESVGKAAAGGAIKGALGAVPFIGPAFLAASAAGDISKMIAGKRANGGPVSAGRSYLVGENQAEIFTPGANGFITPGRGGGVTNNYYVTIETLVGQDAAAQRFILDTLHMAQQRGSLGFGS